MASHYEAFWWSVFISTTGSATTKIKQARNVCLSSVIQI